MPASGTAVKGVAAQTCSAVSAGRLLVLQWPCPAAGDNRDGDPKGGIEQVHRDQPAMSRMRSHAEKGHYQPDQSHDEGTADVPAQSLGPERHDPELRLPSAGQQTYCHLRGFNHRHDPRGPESADRASRVARLQGAEPVVAFLNHAVAAL